MKDAPFLAPDERLDEVNEDITLIQKKNGLTFGTDAFLLSAFCKPKQNARAADFGCGTGIISLLTAARGKYAHIHAVEIQDAFAELASRNITLNRLESAITVLKKDVRELKPSDFGGELDVVLANPPYMRAESGFASPHEQKQLARHEHCGGIADFASAAARCLKYGGTFYTVFRPDRLSALLCALQDAGFAPKRMIFVHDSIEKPPCMVLTEARLGGAEGLSVLPPLFLHEVGENALSARAAQIYESCSFDA